MSSTNWAKNLHNFKLPHGKNKAFLQTGKVFYEKKKTHVSKTIIGFVGCTLRI